MNDDKLMFWNTRRDQIKSKSGVWRGGEYVLLHQHDLLNDLLGSASFMQVLTLCCTGKLIDKKTGYWLDQNFIGISYPDSRIWCNSIGALGGDASASAPASACAGILASESRAYGGSITSLVGMTFIQGALKEVQEGKNVCDILKNAPSKGGKPMINGYARPVDKVDERIPPYEKLSKEMGFEIGPHLSLGYEISEYLTENFNMAMNFGGYANAFLSDQGFTPDEMRVMKSVATYAGVLACHVEYEPSCGNTYLPLRCDDINYTGRAKRTI
ncbi:MAG: hypothetical protein OQJ89_11810 [Kangiellaceae bacterium]|nr:hypothetical protein [Kangiellaceae bacterium]MCW9017645.1 hypothetical protein [Kangiellaceae bacterium]